MRLVTKKKWLVTLLCVGLAGALVVENVEARGRGGGGGGGRAGGGGGARSSGGRSPSMSRPSSQPSARPSGGSRPNTSSRPTPNTGNRPTPNTGNRPKPNTGNRPTPNTGNRPTPNTGNRPTPNTGNRPKPNTGNRPTPNTGNRPTAGGGNRPGNNPSRSDLNNFLDLKGSGPSTRPAAGVAGGAAAGGAAAEFLKQRPTDGNRPATRPAPQPGQRPNAGDRVRPGEGDRVRPADRDRDRVRPEDRDRVRPEDRDRVRPEDRDRVGHRPERVENRQAWQEHRRDHVNDVRDYAQRHPNHYRGWYNNEFWHNHPCRWNFAPGTNWWRWATWGAVTGWVTSSWGQPVYYNYGDNVYYENGDVYQDGQVVATTEQYSQQAQSLAESVPDVKPDDAEWMSLGVFALTNAGESTGTDPTIYLQLAVSKQGIIAGTIQNTATDSVQNIEGMVDPKTQRAAWGIEKKDWPIMETGISNLTQDDAPALLHFEDGETQQWLLVRMQEPEA